MIPLSEPNLGQLEYAAVLDALRSGFVSSVGPAVDEFEASFATAVGAEHAIACSSGTAAIHVALIIAGVSRGDEVLCSDFTFAGSANPIAYLGAEPVFIDSDERTWNADPGLVIEELERRAREGRRMPAAVEIVHVLGQPADIGPVLDAAARFGVPVIEDAAESLGATWSSGGLAGRHTGAVGTIGCFSFNGNKIATSGGGGMIVTNDADLAKRAKHLTTQAKVPAVGYLHDEVGYNYRLTNLAAALGNAQLSRIDEFVTAKRRIAQFYDEMLDDLGVTLPPRVDGFDSTYWLYSVLTRDTNERDAFVTHLARHGIQARALWRPMHAQPPFSAARRLGGTVADTLFERGVSLPSSTHLGDGERDRVAAAVRTFYAG